MTNLKPSRAAVFLDRDGIINEDRGYTYKQEDLILIRGIVSAIRLLHEREFFVIVVSNQAGIAYGYYKETDMRQFNEALQKELRSHGAQVDAFYFCPHHETKGIGEYKRICDCRKPKRGLLIKAAKDFNVDLSKSFMVGDTWNDIIAGRAAGCKTILVKTGRGKEELLRAEEHNSCDFIAEDLSAAAQYILSF